MKLRLWILTYLSITLFPGCTCRAQNTEIVYLSGKGPADAKLWDFHLNTGRNSGQWSKIPVPSNWELQGFGTYEYGYLKEKKNETGMYKTTFHAPIDWKDKTIRLVFCGAMTDTEAFINGRSAGEKHQGGFYRFKYNITSLVRFGRDNELKAVVHKKSDDSSVEAAEKNADYWTFGGIYRPVYLEILPNEYIDWISIDAQMDGQFGVDVHLAGIKKANTITAQIHTLEGLPIEKLVSVKLPSKSKQVELITKINNPKLWTAETPNLYKIRIALYKGSQLIHEIEKHFGFRTFEIRPKQGLFLNGRQIWLKGANRHCFHPDTGRCLSAEMSRRDIELIKEMNMNAVRCSHYPPDEHFLDLCDQMGLYVLDELAGWQKPPYNARVGKKLIREIVTRDSCHPSILFWDNANEGGWNSNLDSEFGKYDRQNRPVLHPWESCSGVNTAHYLNYHQHQSLVNGQKVTKKNFKYIPGDIYMPTEFLHGLYDGGHGAGLDDYWRHVHSSEYTGGGFLWALIDECVKRTDLNDVLDSAGIAAPDGLMGPYREKHGSFYTVREIWSPIYIDTAQPWSWSSQSARTIPIENRYSFTNLSECTFLWQLLQFSGPQEKSTVNELMKQVIPGPELAPGNKGKLTLNAPKDLGHADALRITANGPDGNHVCTWTWPISKPADSLQELEIPVPSAIKTEQMESVFLLSNGNLTCLFDKHTGLLKQIRIQDRKIDFNNGPILSLDGGPKMDRQAPETTVELSSTSQSASIEVQHSCGLDEFCWTLGSNGLLRLDYSYTLKKGVYRFCGISFNYPEEKMKSMRWLGNGPYRVYKNRRKGVQFDIHELAYNDIQPGRTYEGIPFKGYFANLHWVRFETQDGSIRIATDTPNLFFRTYTPIQKLSPLDYGQKPDKILGCEVPYPSGDLSFLHAIPAIGTKFKKPEQLGPQSQPAKLAGTYQGTLYFLFQDF